MKATIIAISSLMTVFLHTTIYVSAESNTVNQNSTYCPFGGCRGDAITDLYSHPDDIDLFVSKEFSYAREVHRNLAEGWEFLPLMGSDVTIDFSVTFGEKTGVCVTQFVMFVPAEKLHYFVDKTLDKIESDTSYKGEVLDTTRHDDELRFRWNGNSVGHLKGVEQVLFFHNKLNKPNATAKLAVEYIYDNYIDCRNENSSLPAIPK